MCVYVCVREKKVSENYLFSSCLKNCFLLVKISLQFYPRLGFIIKCVFLSMFQRQPLGFFVVEKRKKSPLSLFQNYFNFLKLKQMTARIITLHRCQKKLEAQHEQLEFCWEVRGEKEQNNTWWPGTGLLSFHDAWLISYVFEWRLPALLPFLMWRNQGLKRIPKASAKFSA